MRLIFLIPVGVALAIACVWTWQLVRRWNEPPPGWRESLEAYVLFNRLPPLAFWRFSIVSGIVGGLFAAAVGVLVLAG